MYAKDISGFVFLPHVCLFLSSIALEGVVRYLLCAYSYNCMYVRMRAALSARMSYPATTPSD